MRMIDADALIAKQANIAKVFAKSDGQQALMGRVIFNTVSAPTIEAIPVEWLDKMAEQHQSGVFNAYWFVLKTWQKEKEAR